MHNMKKSFFIFGVIGLVLIARVVSPIQVRGEKISNNKIILRNTYSEWYDEYGNLHYPMTNDDDEWKYLEREERYSLCQIPEDIMDTLTTEELLDMIEQYPYFTEIYRFDTSEEAFSNLRQNFVGIEELLRRSDCISVVLNEYENWTIPTDAAFDYATYIHEDTKVDDMNEVIANSDAMNLVRQDARGIYIVSILEMILSCEDIQKIISEDEIEVLSDALIEKNEMKEESECFEYNATSYYSGYCSENLEGIANITTRSCSPIRTRSGTAVAYTTVANPVAVSDATCMAIVSDYLECSIVENGTTAYNCFAYAWLSLDSWNLPYRKSLLVTNANEFVADSKYRKTSSALYVGQVVQWAGHAGVISDVSYSYFKAPSNYVTEPLVVSKWGSGGPLVSHPLSVGWGEPSGFYK